MKNFIHKVIKLNQALELIFQRPWPLFGKFSPCDEFLLVDLMYAREANLTISSTVEIFWS